MKLAVLVLCSQNVARARLSMEEFYSRLDQALISDPHLDVRVILSCNSGEGEEFCRGFAAGKGNVEVFVPTMIAGDASITDAGAGRYIQGLQYCSGIADLVLELDAEGAHNPLEATPFIRAMLNGKKAVFSTRFANGGKDYYPLSRCMSSLGITVLSNLMLGLGRYISDMASGFEAFNSEVLKAVFKVRPPEKWITMRTTTVLIQTELRSYVLWYLGYQDRSKLYTDLAVLPICYGKEKSGAVLPASVGRKALKGFYLLWRGRQDFISQLR